MPVSHHHCRRRHQISFVACVFKNAFQLCTQSSSADNPAILVCIRVVSHCFSGETLNTSIRVSHPPIVLKFVPCSRNPSSLPSAFYRSCPMFPILSISSACLFSGNKFYPVAPVFSVGTERQVTALSSIEHVQ